MYDDDDDETPWWRGDDLVIAGGLVAYIACLVAIELGWLP